MAGFGPPFFMVSRKTPAYKFASSETTTSHGKTGGNLHDSHGENNPVR